MSIFTLIGNSRAGAKMDAANRALQAYTNVADSQLREFEGTAEDTLRRSQQESYEAQLGAYNDINALNNPYAQAGTQAFMNLSDMNRNGAFDITPDKVMMDPGFDFRMQEAAKALNRTAAGRSRLFSGGSGKQMEEYLQNLASNEYGAAYGRARQNAQDTYNRYMGISGAGEQAISRIGAARSNLADRSQAINTNIDEDIFRSQLNLGQNLADLSLRRGNITAQGYGQKAALGQSNWNEIGNMVGSVYGALTPYLPLSLGGSR